MQTVLHKLEAFLLRGPVDTSRVLGVSYSNYAAMKATDRPIPKYIEHAARTILLLTSDQVQTLVRERLK